MTEEIKWVKLKRKNDWGKDFFERPDVVDSMARADKNGIDWEVGQEVMVRWPDGWVATLPLRAKKYCSSYSDQGRTYGASYVLPGIEVLFHGVSFFIELDAFEVSADDWKKK